jgi:molecular chaperone GrpE
MSRKKIIIPTDGEVGKFGGDAAPGKQPDTQPTEPEQAGSAQAAGAGQAGAQPGTPAANTPELLAAEVEQWKDKCLRARAELLNYQKRSEKDRADALRYANAGLVKALLPILDDIERVVAAADQHKSDLDTVISGLRLTLENFVKALRDFGVQRIEAAGKPFDPTRHEAMMQQPSTDYVEPTVLTEAARGYQLHDRVLRPARVIISKPVTPAAGEAAQGSED